LRGAPLSQEESALSVSWEVAHSDGGDYEDGGGGDCDDGDGGSGDGKGEKPLSSVSYVLGILSVSVTIIQEGGHCVTFSGCHNKIPDWVA
jgi:hypothetical protein